MKKKIIKWSILKAIRTSQAFSSEPTEHFVENIII